MASDELGGVVRAVLSALGGIAVGKGWVDANTALSITGALVPVIVAWWSVRAKKAAKS